MNPAFTLQHAITHLQNAMPGDKTQARIDAMHILSQAYQALETAHLTERPDFTPQWMKSYARRFNHE